MYCNIEIDVKIIRSFLIEEKRCDSLPLFASNNKNIDDKIPAIVEKNYSSGVEVKGGFLSTPSNIPIPILLKNCKNTQNIKILGWRPTCSFLHHEEFSL